MAAAMSAGDYETASLQISPRLVRLVGGRAQIVQLWRSAMEGLKAKGVRILSIEVKEATRVVRTPGLLWVVLPTQTNVAFHQDTGHLISYFLGTSEDGGETWTFSDGSGMADAEMVAVLYPDLPPDLSLPKPQPPVVGPRSGPQGMVPQ